MYGRQRRGSGGRLSGRIIIAGLVALFAVVGYFSSTRVEQNPITGEEQRVSLTPEQEIAMGLQAAPTMAQQHGGLHPNAEAQALVDRVGRRIVANSQAGRSPYQFDFHLLADTRTVNAFALPGGQIFITWALASMFETEGELAGVLGHEIGHVVARHSAEQIAKAKLTQGLTGAMVIAAYDPSNPSSRGSAQMAQLIGQVINTKYGRSDELESDRLGVEFMADAGYDPRGMLGVMRVLAQASQGPRPPEMLSTHPDPENRYERVEELIAQRYPNGVPDELIR